MAQVFDSLTDELQQFIRQQSIFFVATAPLSPTGHINISPKGLDCLRILGGDRIAYLDLTGSGNETSAHLQENGRMTLMFCAFAGAPKILRLYGQGKTVLPHSLEWDELVASFALLPGARQIILLQIDRVQTSCGMGVPLFEAIGQRQGLVEWASKKGESGIEAYQRQKNQVSIDGLPTPLGTIYSPYPKRE